MPYEVKLHREAVKTLSKMKTDIRSRLIPGLHALRDDPFHGRLAADILRLRGTRELASGLRDDEIVQERSK
jgi:mRNA-degrading endonuclease RelE of RelBE toxin-antitoxin system